MLTNQDHYFNPYNLGYHDVAYYPNLNQQYYDTIKEEEGRKNNIKSFPAKDEPYFTILMKQNLHFIGKETDYMDSIIEKFNENNQPYDECDYCYNRNNKLYYNEIDYYQSHHNNDRDDYEHYTPKKIYNENTYLDDDYIYYNHYDDNYHNEGIYYNNEEVYCYDYDYRNIYTY